MLVTALTQDLSVLWSSITLHKLFQLTTPTAHIPKSTVMSSHRLVTNFTGNQCIKCCGHLCLRRECYELMVPCRIMHQFCHCHHLLTHHTTPHHSKLFPLKSTLLIYSTFKCILLCATVVRIWLNVSSYHSSVVLSAFEAYQLVYGVKYVG